MVGDQAGDIGRQIPEECVVRVPAHHDGSVPVLKESRVRWAFYLARGIRIGVEHAMDTSFHTAGDARHAASCRAEGGGMPGTAVSRRLSALSPIGTVLDLIRLTVCNAGGNGPLAAPPADQSAMPQAMRSVAACARADHVLFGRK